MRKSEVQFRNFYFRNQTFDFRNIMNKILVEGIKIYAYHGCLEEEGKTAMMLGDDNGVIGIIAVVVAVYSLPKRLLGEGW